ncbi:MAG TPA: hypothetical protein VFS40_14975 [Gemmatimonadales bacterium]|nr:hypothetical protein [Gemmatimonadales bacterium]
MATRLMAIVGSPGAGKTTLREALASEFRRRGLRVALLDPPPDAAGGPAVLARTRRLASDSDLVLAEGPADPGVPRIEVHRRATGTPLYDAAAADADDWVALVTDDRALEARCRVFRIHDTMWLQLLANLVWDRAKMVVG